MKTIVLWAANGLMLLTMLFLVGMLIFKTEFFASLIVKTSALRSRAFDGRAGDSQLFRVLSTFVEGRAPDDWVPRTRSLRLDTLSPMMSGMFTTRGKWRSSNGQRFAGEGLGLTRIR
jgi:hypothetical protein